MTLKISSKKYLPDPLEKKGKIIRCPYCETELELEYVRSGVAEGNGDLALYCPECHECLGGIAAQGIILFHRYHEYEYIRDEFNRLDDEDRFLRQDPDELEYYRRQALEEQEKEEEQEGLMDQLAEETAQLQDLREEMEAETKAEALYQLEQSRNDANTPA